MCTGNGNNNRVCANEPGLELSGAQALAHQQLADYLSGGGTPLLVLCCFVWFMLVFNDLGSSLRVMRAVFRLRGPHTVISKHPTSATHEIISLSRTRVACFLAVQVYRSVLSVILLVGGTWFLLVTIDTQSLLLNT